MSGDSEQGTEEGNVEPLSNVRIMILMSVVAVFGSLICGIYVSSIFGIGFFVGGLLSLGNYFWMNRTLKGIFDRAIAGEQPRFMGAAYFMRYLTLGGILAVVYLSHVIPIVAVLLGLASFALAIIFEAIFRLFNSFSNKKGL